MSDLPPFFRAEARGGRWWLIDAAGRPFVSKGVNAVRLDADRVRGGDRIPYRDHALAAHGTPEAWRDAVSRQLAEWGFNTLGAWSDPDLAAASTSAARVPLADCAMIDLGAEFARRQAGASGPGGAWQHGLFPDVFDPEFARFAHEAAQRLCRARADSPTRLGWFLDNELRWGPDWRSRLELLVVFLNLPAAAPGRRAALRFLEKRHPSVEHFNAIWKTSFPSWTDLAAAAEIPSPWLREPLYAQNPETERALDAAEPARAWFVADCDAFAGELAEEYFRVASAALKTAAPRQLNLGSRFAYVPPAPVVAAAARHVDVLSFNCYELDPLPVIETYAVHGRPLLVGEFSFRSEDSGLPNTQGAGPWVKTQRDRAAAYERYVRRALSHPALVGYHWFKHADQPAEGRFDGENSNYGLLRIDGEPYADFVPTVARVNALAESLHETDAPAVSR